MAADLAKFKADLHEHVQEAALGIHTKWVEGLQLGADLDDYRKYMEWAGKVTGAEVDKKQDANSNLPVFNFVFHNGGVEATMVKPPKATELVEEVQPEAVPLATLDLAPKPQPVQVPVDIDDMMSALDDMLGIDD